MLEQSRTQELRVPAQAEEPVALLDPLERPRRMKHAFSIDDLGVLLERFAPHAVPPLVGLLVEVRRVVLEDALDQGANARAVPSVRGADELIVGDAELCPHGSETLGQRIDERLRRDAL